VVFMKNKALHLILCSMLMSLYYGTTYAKPLDLSSVVVSGLDTSTQLLPASEFMQAEQQEITVFSTPSPFPAEGEPPYLPYHGLDIFNQGPLVDESVPVKQEDGMVTTHSQQVAIQFISQRNVQLTEISIYLMSNAGTIIRPSLELSLHESRISPEDNNREIPVTGSLYSWKIDRITATSWYPEKDTLLIDASENVVLEKGKTYWLMATSENQAGSNAIWTMSHNPEEKTEYVAHKTHIIFTDEHGNVVEEDNIWNSGYGNSVSVEIKGKKQK
jgi:hypothetical protein